MRLRSQDPSRSAYFSLLWSFYYVSRLAAWPSQKRYFSGWSWPHYRATALGLCGSLAGLAYTGTHLGALSSETPRCPWARGPRTEGSGCAGRPCPWYLQHDLSKKSTLIGTYFSFFQRSGPSGSRSWPDHMPVGRLRHRQRESCSTHACSSTSPRIPLSWSTTFVKFGARADCLDSIPYLKV